MPCTAKLNTVQNANRGYIYIIHKPTHTQPRSESAESPFLSPGEWSLFFAFPALHQEPGSIPAHEEVRPRVSILFPSMPPSLPASLSA